MDASTAVLVGTLVVVLCVLAFVLWQARNTPRYAHPDEPRDARRAVRPPRRAPPLPPDLRPHVEQLIAQGRPARAINLILKQTELEIDEAHAVVDAVAAKVAKPGQHAWQAAQEADETARLAKEAAENPGGLDDDHVSVSSVIVGLDRGTQLQIERMLQRGRLDEAVETVKENTGLTTRQARTGLEAIRAQLQRRKAGSGTGQRVRVRATAAPPAARSVGRGTAQGDGER